MKKLFGLKIGGLQHKILNLVLMFLLITIACWLGISAYRASQLTKIVNSAKEEQEKSIKAISENTMHQVIESSLTKTNALQAYIANDMFRSVKQDVATMQTLAEGVFKGKDILGPHPFALPDPSTDGEITAQVLYEDGVDIYKSELLPIAANMTDTMIAMYKNSSYTTNCYIGLSDGTNLCIDNIASNKYDADGQMITFPVRERQWYTDAVEKDGITFTDVMTDTYTGMKCITCSAPVKVDGKLIGVVGIDVFLSDMSEYVNRSVANGGFICVLDNKGRLIFTPESSSPELKDLDNSVDLRTLGNQQLADFVNMALTESTGLRVVNTGGRDYYMTASPLETLGWSVVSVVEKESTEIPTKQMLEEYERINDNSAKKYSDGSNALKTQALVAIVVILLLGSLAALWLAGRIVKPIESMTADIIEGSRTGKLFEMKDIYRTKDEIEVLAESFDDLSKKTKQYILDITRITKEKERIGTELELARRIQSDMVPNIYPAFPDRPEFDIYASMDTAKEVGGDFYDFFLIDDDHLGLVMADVSGKGVPAALFMMMSKILINNFAMMGSSPAQVLEKTNAVICQNNEEEMFVTVWFGILEISTGKITAANAGHEYPIIKSANGEFKLFKDTHGFVLGGMDPMRYKEYEMTLERGGALFLYTDGVPEATNGSDEMFGPERLLETLNSVKDGKPVDLLSKVKQSVDGFVGEADQFDDLTMLAITLTDPRQ